MSEEGLRGRNVLHSLRVHSCASMLNNICSESMSAARMCLYSKVKLLEIHGIGGHDVNIDQPVVIS